MTLRACKWSSSMPWSKCLIAHGWTNIGIELGRFIPSPSYVVICLTWDLLKKFSVIIETSLYNIACYSLKYLISYLIYLYLILHIALSSYSYLELYLALSFHLHLELHLVLSTLPRDNVLHSFDLFQDNPTTTWNLQDSIISSLSIAAWIQSAQ